MPEIRWIWLEESFVLEFTAPTVCVRMLETPPRKFGSPLYCAVMFCEPSPSDDVVKVARLLMTGADPIGLLPS